MKKVGFDNDKYLKLQSEHIRERIAKFGGSKSASKLSAESSILNSAESFLMTIMRQEFFRVLNLTVNYRCFYSLKTMPKLLSL